MYVSRSCPHPHLDVIADYRLILCVFAGAVIIFTALLSVAFLRSRIKRYMWIGMLLIVFGLVFVGVSDVLFGGVSAGTGLNGIISGETLTIRVLHAIGINYSRFLGFFLSCLSARFIFILKFTKLYACYHFNTWRVIGGMKNFLLCIVMALNSWHIKYVLPQFPNRRIVLNTNYCTGNNFVLPVLLIVFPKGHTDVCEDKSANYETCSYSFTNRAYNLC